tara:strand:+ start:18 stop:275 length:258 start_codon:yes stop_codon:yes gene_type:complete
MKKPPQTIVYLSVNEYNFIKRELKGIVEASDFRWDFTWAFGDGKLEVQPPLGRALIENPLLRFLLKKDYELESGNSYKFTISSRF